MIAGHLPELVIVLVLALVFFGPKRLPEVGSALGQGIRDFKKGMSHLTEEKTEASPFHPDEVTTLPDVAPTSHVVPESNVIEIQKRPVA